MIIDASVAVPWLIDTPFSVSARQVPMADAMAPVILLDETANVLLKYVRHFDLPIETVHKSIFELQRLFSEFVDDRSLLTHAISIAAAHQHKVYDCLYVALALERGEPLATADRRLAALAKKLSIETHLVEPAL